jgi:dTDP-4-amino-4,6-dideoxyglucose formyltransferase
MKILFLTNSKLSQPLIDWLEEYEQVIVFNNKLSVENIENIKPDYVVSYNYKHIIKQDVLSLVVNRIINLHISYLPHNRGADPNVWSHLNNTPKGATIHFIDKGLDTGDILVQKKVRFNDSLETLASSYKKLHQVIQQLFKDNWQNIKTNKITNTKHTGKTSYHQAEEFGNIKMELLGKEDWDVKISVLKDRYTKMIKNNHEKS